jgi:hypothetical protein
MQNTAFITYTKGTRQYVTSPEWETQFLNWLATQDDTSSYKRETITQVAVVCSPRIVHQTEKKEATILQLVKTNE